MAVKIDTTYKAIHISWDLAKVVGDTVDLEAAGVDDRTPTVNLPNDGFATLVYPPGFKGKSKITVLGANGTFDDGEIAVAPAKKAKPKVKKEPVKATVVATPATTTVSSYPGTRPAPPTAEEKPAEKAEDRSWRKRW